MSGYLVVSNSEFEDLVHGPPSGTQWRWKFIRGDFKGLSGIITVENPQGDTRRAFARPASIKYPDVGSGVLLSYATYLKMWVS